MDALKKARQLYRDGAHAQAINFIKDDPELSLRRPLVEEIAYNLRQVEGNAAAVEFLLEKLPDYPKMYPRWTRMMAHWSIGKLADNRAAEICELALNANTTHADRLAMTGRLFFQMHKLFVRLGRAEIAQSLIDDGLGLGFIECIYLQADGLDIDQPSEDAWGYCEKLVAAKYLSGEIWTGLTRWITKPTADRWLSLLQKHEARLTDVIGFHQARARALSCCNQYVLACGALETAILLGANGVGSLWCEIVALHKLAGVEHIDDDLRLKALHQAVVLNPSNRLVLEDLKAELLRRNPQVELAKELDKIQRNEQRLILTIFFELRGKQPVDTLLKRYQKQFEAEMAEPGYKACQSLWDAFRRGAPLADSGMPDNHSAKVFVICQMQGATRINIARNWAQDREFMKASKINTRKLRRLHADLTAEIDPAWAQYLATADYPNDAAKATVIDRETKCCFQNRVVNTGKFELFDLAHNDEEVGVVDSFYTNGRTVFTFAGQAPFILVTAGAGSRPFMIYYPDENLIVDLGARLGHMLDDFHMNNLLSRYITRLAQHTAEYNTSRETVRSRIGKDTAPRKLVVNINTAENFAHHVWNFYTGLERQLRFGSMEHVSKLHFAGTEFFGALRDIFPEVAHLPLNTERVEGNVDPVGFDPDRLLITLGGYFISRPLQARISKVCSAFVQHVPAAMDRLNRLGSAGKVVWFGLRTGDKSWISQEQGLISVISQLQTERQDVICVLDAFSLPANQAVVPAAWQNAFDRLSDMCERIRLAVPRKHDVLNLTGVSLPETILIAQKTDAYVTPLGTTQHKVGWFTTAPGLIYIPNATAKLDIMRRPGTWESEGITLPDFLVAEHEFEGLKRDVNDRRANLFNMELNTDDIYKWLDGKLG